MDPGGTEHEQGPRVLAGDPGDGLGSVVRPQQSMFDPRQTLEVEAFQEILDKLDTIS